MAILARPFSRRFASLLRTCPQEVSLRLLRLCNRAQVEHGSPRAHSHGRAAVPVHCLRQELLAQERAGGAPAHPHWRAALPVFHVPRCVCAQELAGHSPQAPRGREALCVQVLWQDLRRAFCAQSSHDGPLVECSAGISLARLTFSYMGAVSAPPNKGQAVADSDMCLGEELRWEFGDGKCSLSVFKAGFRRCSGLQPLIYQWGKEYGDWWTIAWL